MGDYKHGYNHSDPNHATGESERVNAETAAEMEKIHNDIRKDGKKYRDEALGRIVKESEGKPL